MMQILIQFMQDSKVDTIAWYVELWHYLISSEVAKTLFFWTTIVIVLYLIKYLWNSTSYRKSNDDVYINHSNGLAEKLIIELNKSQNICIMLKGKWGSGKTSFYENQVQPSLNKPVFLSCLNYNDIDSLKIDIMNYTKPFLKFITPIKILYLIFGDDFLMPKNRIIVFDDFERAIQHDDFDVDRLINVLIMLKDKHHNSLLLLCNENSIIGDNNFIKYREKLVGKIIRLPVLGIDELEIYNNLANLLKNDQNNEKYQAILDNTHKIYELESNIRLIIQLIQAINNMIKLEGDEIKFNIRLLLETNLIFFMYAYFARGEEYQKLLTIFDISEPNNGKLKYDIEEIKNNLESFDYEFHNQLGIDYLKLELDELLQNNNSSEFKTKALDYLNKFISKETKNKFNLDYLLYLLFIVWIAKVTKVEELFEKILSNVEFMNQDTFKPVRDIVGSINPIFHLYEQKQCYSIFGITSEISNDVNAFEKAYCLFYRNKVINKFIESTSEILWSEVNLFADGWFIRCCNEEDQNVLSILGEDINGVAELYVKSNKYLNLNIINKWIGEKVEPNILLEYYAKVLVEFEDEKQRNQNNIYFFDWLLSEKIEKAPKIKGKFTIIREKFTQLNKMIKDYVSNDENVNKQYISLVQKHSDLIKKLDYQGSNSTD
jgi:hypothetical protein